MSIPSVPLWDTYAALSEAQIEQARILMPHLSGLLQNPFFAVNHEHITDIDQACMARLFADFVESENAYQGSLDAIERLQIKLNRKQRSKGSAA